MAKKAAKPPSQEELDMILMKIYPGEQVSPEELTKRTGLSVSDVERRLYILWQREYLEPLKPSNHFSKYRLTQKGKLEILSNLPTLMARAAIIWGVP